MVADMDLSYTDEQQFLREAVRGTLDREAPLSKVREWVLEGDAEQEPALVMAARQGWTGIGVDEARGGQGGSLLELTVLAEELGRAGVPADPLYATLLGTVLLRSSDDPAALALVEAAAEGEAVLALARTGGAPLDAGPAPDGPRTLVLGAPLARTFLDVRDGTVSTYDAASATVTPHRLIDRTRCLGDVVLPAQAGGSFAGASPEQLTDLAAWGAVLVSADALGACQRLLDLTVEYVGQRVQFGVAVGSFQAVKHAASEMLVAIEGTRAAIQYAAWAVGGDVAGASTDAWVAKSRAARMAVLVADKALFLHGAVGYTWEHDLQLLFKRAKSDAALLGGASAYEDRIADALELV
ncbi:MAG: acyl-CoA dehydrogenase [Solirubrobacterales bacterium]|nr:acyl-CoA dehydrogenase [Solirubrobacterales bacterium]